MAHLSSWRARTPVRSAAKCGLFGSTVCTGHATHFLPCLLTATSVTADCIPHAQFALTTMEKVMPEYEKMFDLEYPLPKLDLLAVSIMLKPWILSDCLCMLTSMPTAGERLRPRWHGELGKSASRRLPDLHHSCCPIACHPGPDCRADPIPTARSGIEQHTERAIRCFNGGP